MKVFNVLKKIILILSFVVFIVAFIFGGITLKSPDVAFSAIIVSFVVLGCVGFSLFFSENKIAHKIGLGISLGVMSVQLYAALSLLGQSTAAIFGLVSTILFTIYFLMYFIGYLAVGDDNKNDPEKDSKIRKILGWKKLASEGIISDEEFEDKRLEILGLKNKKEK